MKRPIHLRRTISLWVVLALGAGRALMGTAQAAERAQVDLTDWAPPGIRTLADDPFGKLVKYGRTLMVDTANQIGPAAADPAKRYSGNNLSCQSCHLQAGTQPYSMPVTGVWGQFPQYRGREGEVGTLEERINGCMERSMSGRALPLDSLEMKAYLAYMKWLSTGIPDGAKLTGAGTMAVKAPTARSTSAMASRSMRRPVPSATARMASASAPQRGMDINSRRCGDRTATTTAPAWLVCSTRPPS